MKIASSLLFATALSVLACHSALADTTEKEITLFDGAVFYDGYLLENNPDSLLDDGILRHTTSLYAVKMTDEQLDAIGDSLYMKVIVSACCDNYDRIGNINIALVPKGSESYKTSEVERIEIGRFITPFMNKNWKPKSVDYYYNLPYLSYILRDASLREKYDLWMEYELFGVPYAANSQVVGCAKRNDVFKGYLYLYTSQPAAAQTDDDVLVPIVMKKPEYIGGNLNNYSKEGTDTIGKTTKTYEFEVPRDVNDGMIVLVTSNHGANEGGEEYNRRWHYVYVDDQLVLTYKPGRTSCEPFRKYNTQTNGIYGYSARSDEEWQSFSNWCPGDVIDNRIIDLGNVKAGTHKVRISVPEAEFVGGQGDIPVSMFFQGLVSGEFAAIDSPIAAEPQAHISARDGKISVDSQQGVMSIEVYDLQGRCLVRNDLSREINYPAGTRGIYLVNVELMNGVIATHKVALE